MGVIFLRFLGVTLTVFSSIQGNVWTEYIADFGHVQRMTLPRMAAIAEIAWAYDRKDYDDFEKRAKRLLPELYGNAKLKFSEFFFEDIE